MSKQEKDIIRTLERLGTRSNVLDQHHLAEVISLILWDPSTGLIDQAVPHKESILRLEKVHKRVESLYLDRYKGLPPHD